MFRIRVIPILEALRTLVHTDQALLDARQPVAEILKLTVSTAAAALGFSNKLSGDDPLLQGRNLEIGYSVQGNSGHMTHHSGADMTSFIARAGSGDHTADPDGFAYEYTTTSWLFLTGLDVMAPADTVVLCVFGDSITDGTHPTLNTNDRLANVLSRRLHDAYGTRSASSTKRLAVTASVLRPCKMQPLVRPRSIAWIATCSGCQD